MTLAENTKAIRRALKSQVPGLSVRMGTGTARAWIEIKNARHQFGDFTAEQIDGLMGLGLCPGMNLALIGPDERQYWLEKLDG